MNRQSGSSYVICVACFGVIKKLWHGYNCNHEEILTIQLDIGWMKPWMDGKKKKGPLLTEGEREREREREGRKREEKN